MNVALVGYTGFVGSNILLNGNIDKKYNSKNIQDAFGTNPDILIYSGVRAEKFLSNKEPERDFENIKEAFENIKKINPKKLVLISTIDVYKNPVDVNENSNIDTDGLHPYGLNRYYLEKLVEENFNDYLIVRLPGLYGENLKKNFIYDLIKIIPSMLTEEKFNELCKKNYSIKSYYEKQDNGFYKYNKINDDKEKELKEYFKECGFSALNFTDSRGNFQFYNLSYLWDHIQIALNNRIKKLNIATEPITINEIYRSIYGEDFSNKIAKVIPNYDYKTIHYKYFNGENGYIFTKDFIINDIKEFIMKRL